MAFQIVCDTRNFLLSTGGTLHHVPGRHPLFPAKLPGSTCLEEQEGRPRSREAVDLANGFS